MIFGKGMDPVGLGRCLSLMRKVRTLALSSLFIASTVLLTTWPTVPLFQGYLNFGDVLVISMGYVLGFPLALMGGVGAALADLLLGYGQYAFFTLIIKGLEALIIAVFAAKSSRFTLGVYLLAGTWMAIGYGLTDMLLTQNLAMFIPSFGYNILQGLICASLAYGLRPLLTRLKQSL